MKKIISFTVVLLSAFLVGCAGTPQQPLEVSDSFWTSQSKKVGIVMNETPKADVHLPGAGCLLCLAVAEAANGSISKQVENFDAGSLSELPSKLSEKLDNNEIPFVLIQEPLFLSSLPKNSSKHLNKAKKDFSDYRTKYDITHLLVIEINQIGIIRSYANYVPTSDPQGIFQAAGYIVDLENNTYTWYKPVSIKKSVADGWDEPPTFPGLTNAYYQALELGKEAILQPFTDKPSDAIADPEKSETANTSAADEEEKS